MAGVGKKKGIRKALGALKDTTKVGLVKAHSDYKGLDIAIVKATNHLECLVKEKHIGTIFEAVSSSRPRADVVYCVNSLVKRLAKTHNWAVAIKTLIVIHRALREVAGAFQEELLNYTSSKGFMLHLSHFKDDSSPNAWEYSAWVRTYALYLEERLECYRVLKYDVEKESSRISEADIAEVLEHLPAMQQLLFRLLGCQPEGEATCNKVIRYALSLVVDESIKLYSSINSGTLKLVDKFFNMQRHDAVRAIDIYKKTGIQADKLSEFYEICKDIKVGNGENSAKVEKPPASFIAAMEEYVKHAPCTSSNRILTSIGSSMSPRMSSDPIVAYECSKNKQEELEAYRTSMDPDPSETDETPGNTERNHLLGLDDLDSSAEEMEETDAETFDIAAPNFANCATSSEEEDDDDAMATPREDSS